MGIDVDQWASVLLEAIDTRSPIPPLSLREPDLDVATGYDIQQAVVERRVARGERIAGAKIGVTSLAKQRQLGLDSPVFGTIFEAGVHQPGAALSVRSLCNPRLEAEYVFVLGRDLAGPGVTRHDVLDATASVHGGIEIVGSRYAGGVPKLGDIVADGAAAHGFVLGSTALAPHATDLAAIGCRIEVDGTVVGTGVGADLLDHPANSVALLANHLGARGLTLRAGWTILAGSPADSVPLVPGLRMTVHYDHLGSVSAHGVD